MKKHSAVSIRKSGHLAIGTSGHLKTNTNTNSVLPQRAQSKSGHLAIGPSEDQHQHQKRFTTEGTEDTEKGKTLPLMNADNTDKENGLPRIHADGRKLEEQSKTVGWRPSADVFRSNTREGMEAYEAWFRMKVAPRLGEELRPTQPGLAPEDPAQLHANLG